MNHLNPYRLIYMDGLVDMNSFGHFEIKRFFIAQVSTEVWKFILKMTKITKMWMHIVESGIWTHALSDQNLNLAP